jgi:hypothetical protein
VVFLFLFIGAQHARDDAETARAAAVEREHKLIAEMDVLRTAEREARARLEDLQRQQPSTPAVTPAARTTPEPTRVCPGANGRYWREGNTFAISSAFDRRCVVDVAAWLYHNDSTVAELFKKGTGAAGSAQFVTYLMSINGMRVNPLNCLAACLVDGLSETKKPVPGDIVAFIDGTFGVLAPDNEIYELQSSPDAVTVREESLRQAQVRTYLNVTSPRAAKPAPKPAADDNPPAPQPADR